MAPFGRGAITVTESWATARPTTVPFPFKSLPIPALLWITLSVLLRAELIPRHCVRTALYGHGVVIGAANLGTAQRPITGWQSQSHCRTARQGRNHDIAAGLQVPASAR